MSFFTVTYPLTDGTTAFGSQVYQNFTDVINASSDGTKDFNVQDFTSNGNTTLGNSSGDDLTVNASLASSIPLKTTYTYDIGVSTIGLRCLYFGSSDSAARTVKIQAGIVGSSYTLTLPISGGTAGYVLETNGSGTTTWFPHFSTPDAINYAVTASVAANALTVALKNLAGSDPSSTSPVFVMFRNTTAATGTPVLRSSTAATSVVVPDTATLGHADNIARYIYVYLIDNAGALELAVSSSFFDEGTVRTTTTISTGADLNSGIYSTTGRTSVPIRCIARLSSTQSTAGSWGVVPTEISFPPFYFKPPVAVYKCATGQSLTTATVTIIDFLSKVLDTMNCVVTSPWAFTAPMAGVYHVAAHLRFNNGGGWAAGEAVAIFLYKNGAEYLLAIGTQVTAHANYVDTPTLAADIQLAAGDTVDIRGYQDSGANLTLEADGGRNYVSIHYVGPT